MLPERNNPYREGSSYHLVFEKLAQNDGMTVDCLRQTIRNAMHKEEYLAANDVKVVLSPRRELSGRLKDVRGHRSAKGHLYYAEQDSAGVWRVFPRNPPLPPLDPHRRREGGRCRGIDVQIGGCQVHARNVPELCREALSYLVKGGHVDRLPPGTLPFATSGRRYLIAREPKHQGGGDFSCPVNVGRYHIEAHKDYAAACRQLGRFMTLCDVPFKVL